VQHLQGEDGRGVLDRPCIDVVERGGAVPDRQVATEMAAHRDRRERGPPAALLPAPPPVVAMAAAQPAPVWLQLVGPSGGGERPQRRVEDHDRAAHEIGEALRQWRDAGRVERGPRQLALQEDRPLQLAPLLADLPEQVGGLDADGQQRGDQVEQLEVLLGERPAALVDRVAYADGLVLDDQRDGQAFAGVEQVDEPPDQPRVVRGVVGHVRATGEEHLDRVAAVPQRHVVGADQLRVVDAERWLLQHQLRALRVVQQKARALDVQQLADGPDQRRERLLVVGGRGHRPADLHEGVDTAFLGLDPHLHRPLVAPAPGAS
jgi:hypothetical protein